MQENGEVVMSLRDCALIFGSVSVLVLACKRVVPFWPQACVAGGTRVGSVPILLSSVILSGDQLSHFQEMLGESAAQLHVTAGDSTAGAEPPDPPSELGPASLCPVSVATECGIFSGVPSPGPVPASLGP
eukprot:1851013-Amphidinium_carterae.1